MRLIDPNRPQVLEVVTAWSYLEAYMQESPLLGKRPKGRSLNGYEYTVNTVTRIFCTCV
ncbi:hypothetical protein DPMN_013113 [Dreissena polymorpha]|uniref:Uncharacterized protein n=1 Tax=Dreissena polymorpha TaxID=45954 RepID=A0A9D4S3D0_DREPO|nr:hypothetical protein DPMN_013113 [Dreissena polymorpha]